MRFTLTSIALAAWGVALLTSPICSCPAFISDAHAALNTKASGAQGKVRKSSTQNRARKTSANSRPNIAKAASVARKKKSSLELEQRSIKGKISTIGQAIKEKEARMQAVTNELRASEQAISRSNRTLKELGEKKASTEIRLSNLREEAKIVDIHVNEAEEIVGQISQTQFLNSRKLSWQAALTGANPNDITRQSALLSYLAREQTKTLDRLENRQKNIEIVRKKTESVHSELIRIEEDEQKHRKRLEIDQASRSIAVDKLKKEIVSQKEQYELLVKNDQELTRLIASINQQIEAAIALESKRAAEAERAKRQKGSNLKDDNRRITQAPTRGDFSRLKGKLTMPTRGEIVARFGQKREGAAANLIRRGLLIRAKAGTPVVATYDGTVVFSNWIRGFGNLIILDHGASYLSVYANNESLFKSVNAKVKQGETIASVGNSGGEDIPGLYFELRHADKPFDPMPYLRSSTLP